MLVVSLSALGAVLVPRMVHGVHGALPREECLVDPALVAVVGPRVGALGLDFRAVPVDAPVVGGAVIIVRTRRPR